MPVAVTSCESSRCARLPFIEAGIAEFAECGFAGARLENVAKRAGVAKGMIYRYLNSLLKNSHPCLFGGIGALAALGSPQICPIYGFITSF
jgi:hypothetical protein